MNAIVIEHVKVSELPDAWRDRLSANEDARVTVRIEPEAAINAATAEQSDDPLFGMWRDHEEMADVASYLQTLRSPRF